MRSHLYFSVTFSWKAIVFSRMETCWDTQLSRSVLLRYCKEKGNNLTGFCEVRTKKQRSSNIKWLSLDQRSHNSHGKNGSSKNALRMNLFIVKVFLFQCFGGLNNDRKLRACLSGATWTFCQRKLYSGLETCFVCAMFINFMMDDSCDLDTLFSLLNHHHLFYISNSRKSLCYVC